MLHSIGTVLVTSLPEQILEINLALLYFMAVV